MRWQAAFSMTIGVVACVGIAVFSGSASAQDIVLNAVAYEEHAPERTVSVEIYNDSEQNLTLKSHFEKELAAQGYTIEANARLVLSIDTRDTSGSWSGGGSTSPIDITNRDNHTGTDAPDVRVRLFDTQRGGIFNQKREYGVTEVSPSQFRIDAVLEDRTDGRRIWEAWTITNVSASDNPALQRAMVTPIVGNIGKTVRDETIPAP